MINWNLTFFSPDFRENRTINFDTINQFVFAIFREIDIKSKKKKERWSVNFGNSIQFSFFISFFAVSSPRFDVSFSFFKIHSFENIVKILYFFLRMIDLIRESHRLVIIV